MVVEPAPTIVTLLPTIAATAVLLLSYVNAPLLLEVGGTKSKDPLLKSLALVTNALSVGAIGFTTNVVVTEPAI